MLVVVLEKPHNKTKGLLNHYMLEVKKDVFVGNVNSKIRNILKNRISQQGQSSLFIYDTNNAQGFEIETTGDLEDNKIIAYIITRLRQKYLCLLKNVRF